MSLRGRSPRAKLPRERRNWRPDPAGKPERFPRVGCGRKRGERLQKGIETNREGPRGGPAAGCRSHLHGEGGTGVAGRSEAAHTMDLRGTASRARADYICVQRARRDIAERRATERARQESGNDKSEAGLTGRPSTRGRGAIIFLEPAAAARSARLF